MGNKRLLRVRPTLSLMSQRNGLSAVVTTIIMIALVMSVITIVWGVVSNLVEEGLEGSNECVKVFDKVKINSRYTCYDSSNQYQFSLSIGDIDVDEVLFAIYSGGSTKSFRISNNIEIISGVTNYPNGGSSIVLPKKNGGLTYIFNLNSVGFGSSPDSLEIAPTINGRQCDSSDVLRDIPNCDVLL